VLACLRGTVCRPLIIPLPTGLLGVRWLILVLTTLLGVGWQVAVLRLVAVCRLLIHFKESVLASLRRLRCDFGVAWAIDAAVGSRCGFAGSAFLAAGAISCGCACGTTAGNSTAAGSPISIGMLTTGVSLIVAASSGSESLRLLGRPATFGVVSSTSERVGVSGRSRRRPVRRRA
jgi:hypothetical protein